MSCFVLLVLQHLWARLLNARDEELADEGREDESRRPFAFDGAVELLMEQTAWWLQRAHLEHSLAMFFAASLDDSSCMTVRLQNLKGKPRAAHFSDDADLLELLAEWMELRSAVRKARRRGAQSCAAQPYNNLGDA